MASKKPKTTQKSAAANASDDANVVRIKASSTPKKSATKEKIAKVATEEKPVKTEKVKKERAKGGVRGGGVLRAFGGYFKGAWVELRQVRWPNRSATWGLTAAVLLFSAFFVVVVLLLDAAFKYMFELILGK